MMKIFETYKNARIPFILLLFVFISSCGSSKKTVNIGGVIVEKTQGQLIADVIDKELKYTTINGKTNFELLPINSKKGIKLATVVKIKRDRVIQLSFRGLFGVEGARITITPDSLFIINRLQKEYAQDNISKYASSHNIFNYYNLQSLLMNGLFLPGDSVVTKDNYKRYKMDVASNMYLLKTIDKSGILYNFAIDGSDKIASTLILSPQKDYTLQWSYSDFIKDGSFTYPTQMVGNVEIKKKRFDVKISYDKLDINKDLDIDMSLPGSKYKQVAVEDIIKTILGMM